MQSTNSSKADFATVGDAGPLGLPQALSKASSLGFGDSGRQHTGCSPGCEVSNCGLHDDPNHDAPYGWVVAFAGFVSCFIAMGWTNSFGIFLPTLVEEFHQPKALLAAVVALGNMLNPFIGLMIGNYADKHGCRWLYVVAAGAMLMATLGASQFKNNFIAFSLTYSIGVGLVMGLIYTPSLGMMTGWFHHHVGLATGIVSSGTAMGTVIVPFVMQRLLEAYGWQKTFFYAGALSVPLLVVAVMTRPRVPYRGSCPRNFNPKAIKTIKTGTFWLLWLIALCQAWAFFIPVIYIANYGNSIGLTPRQSGLLLSILSASTCAGSLFGGVIMSMIGNIWTLRLKYLLSVVALGLWPFCTKLWHLMVFVVFNGFFNGGFLSAMPVNIAEHFPASASMAIAIVFTGWGLGSLIGPIVVGHVEEWIGSWLWPCQITSGILFLGLLVTFFLPKPIDSKGFTLLGGLEDEFSDCDEEYEQDDDVLQEP